MIDYQNQESPWLTLATRIVREDAQRRAQQEEYDDESLYRIQVSEA